ncbi:hypothetical protein [Virgisporangium aurantiacum]|uniref:Uncharacterized protein n=1 Tax=Virgisporangium aurantiacum TaxID=175570 RepID=A0A8J3Z7T6_9ACTN|nr:hypothetical protein [Virgisporangium aurantiacum]GIJ56910.1 hypothetical protein Vau01_044260 [Virgisporangium aurantiacum]
MRRRVVPAALAAVLGAALLVLAGPATPASASSVNSWAYAYVDPVGRPAGALPVDPMRSDSSMKSVAVASKSETGRFMVRFPQAALLATDLGVAHVTAATPQRHCQLDEYLHSGPDVVVYVACWGSQDRGAAGLIAFRSDAAFTVLWTSAPDVISASPGAYAYARVETAYGGFRVARTSGTTVNLLQSAAYRYNVRFGGIGSSRDGGNIQVTTLHTPGTSCVPVEWRDFPAGFQEIVVECQDLEGNPVSADFTVSFTRARSIIGTTANRFAYVETEAGETTTFNSTGGLAGNVWFPTYEDVSFSFNGAPDSGPFLVLATGFVTRGLFCSAYNWSLTPGASVSAATGRTSCAGTGPAPQRMRSFETFLSTGTAPSPEPGEVVLPPDAIRINGFNPSRIGPTSARISFDLTARAYEYASDPAQTTLTVNGTPVPADRIQVNPTQVFASNALVSGRNQIVLNSRLSTGDPVHFEQTVWAGDATVRLSIVDETGAPVRDNAFVEIYAVSDPGIRSDFGVTDGRFDLPNVPRTTVMVEVNVQGRLGSLGFMGQDGSATVVVRGLSTPSTVDNNDFSQGLAGYGGNAQKVSLIPHTEGFYPPIDTSAAATAGKGGAASVDRRGSGAATDVVTARGGTRAAGTPPLSLSAARRAATAAAAPDNDLAVETFGQGPQRVFRTFRTVPGQTDVRLRYRFITSEVPFGFFGTEFDDYFAVSVRTSGGVAREINSMNGLGLAQFDYPSGSTAWRDVVLPVNPNGEVVQVDLTVANVADAFYNSAVVVGFIQPAVDTLTPALRWDPQRGGMELKYTLSQRTEQIRSIDIYFARGTTFESRLGNAVGSFRIAAGTAAGTYTVNIPGSSLGNDPAGTAFLIAVASPTRVANLKDVNLGFGPNAARDPGDVTLVDIVKDGLRVAGQDKATVSSAFRRPEDMARILFDNLTKGDDLAANIKAQIETYNDTADMVINVFKDKTNGLTKAQAVAMRATIQAAMLTKINEVGCENVTQHCVSPAQRITFDIVYDEKGVGGDFAANGNGARFREAVRPRITKVIDETPGPNRAPPLGAQSNNCYHLELAR